MGFPQTVPLGVYSTHLPLAIMSALLSHFADLPIEILEQIFLYLPGQDIVKMEAVRGIVSSSVRSGFDFVLV